MSWLEVVPSIIYAGGQLIEYFGSSGQNETQQDWNNYNTTMNYETSMANIAAMEAIAQYNAGLVQKASQIEQYRIDEAAKFNIATISSIAAFNNSLLDQEEELMWEGLGLDIERLRRERAQERGAIVADQAASGTIIGEGSNADVVVAQMSQEAIDAAILRHGADIQASRILNAKMINDYNAVTEIQRIRWEADMGMWSSGANASLQAAGILTESSIMAMAEGKSAQNALLAGRQGADMQYSTNQSKIGNNLWVGMFNAAAQGVNAWYKTKTPSIGTSSSGSSLFSGSSSYTFGSGYTGNYSLLAEG